MFSFFKSKKNPADSDETTITPDAAAESNHEAERSKNDQGHNGKLIVRKNGANHYLSPWALCPRCFRYDLRIFNHIVYSYFTVLSMAISDFLPEIGDNRGVVSE